MPPHDDHDHDHDHDHHHDHEHPHRHPPQRDHDADPASPYEVLEQAIRELLIEKGVLTAEEINSQVDLMDSRSPALGAKVVARASTPSGSFRPKSASTPRGSTTTRER